MDRDRIKEIRLEAGLSLTQLAEYLNFEDPAKNGADRVREFESGRREPTGPVVRLLQMLEAGVVTWPPA